MAILSLKQKLENKTNGCRDYEWIDIQQKIIIVCVCVYNYLCAIIRQVGIFYDDHIKFANKKL